MVVLIELFGKVDDIATFAQPEVEPSVQLGIDLERGFALGSQRGFVPKVTPLPFDG